MTDICNIHGVIKYGLMTPKLDVFDSFDEDINMIVDIFGI